MNKRNDKADFPTNLDDLARTRKHLGFDDIPVDQDDDMSLREVLRAWIIQTFHLRHPDNKVRRAYLFISHKKYRSWIDDLKWALLADMDDDNKPRRPVAKKTPARTIDQPQVPRRSGKQPTPQQPPASDTAAKSIEINLDFSSLSKLPLISHLMKIRNFRWTRNRVIVAIIVGPILVGGLGWRIIPGLPGVSQISPGTVESTKIDQKPSYLTLLPAGKSIESLGGWHRVSPPDRNPVFAYADKIDNVSIAVSQQPMPEGFKSNIDESIEELAKGYAATDKISAGSQTIYVGTNAKGPQSAILAKADVLILIKSSQKIDDSAWASYVESLNLQNIPASNY